MTPFLSTMICNNTRNSTGVLNKKFTMESPLTKTHMELLLKKMDSFKLNSKNKVQFNFYSNNIEPVKRMTLMTTIQTLFPNMMICITTRNSTGVMLKKFTMVSPLTKMLMELLLKETRETLMMATTTPFLNMMTCNNTKSLPGVFQKKFTMESPLTRTHMDNEDVFQFQFI